MNDKRGTRKSAKRVLPGFGLTLGYTLFYLSIIVLIPLSALVFKTFTLTWPQFWEAVTAPRVLASYRLTFGASLIAALVNVVLRAAGEEVFFRGLLGGVLMRPHGDASPPVSQPTPSRSIRTPPHSTRSNPATPTARHPTAPRTPHSPAPRTTTHVQPTHARVPIP